MKSTSAATLLVATSLLSLTSATGTLHLGLSGKRGFSPSSMPLQRRSGTSGTVNAPLTENPRFVQYYADVTIGTPPQSIKLVVDTGSSDIWAVASSASSCADNGCTLGSFDYTKSSTFNDNGPGQFQDSYVDGSSTTGDFFEDTFGIGGVTVEAMEMGLALNTSLSEGIMGIAFVSGEAGGAVLYPNLVDTMVNQSIINTQAYSLWLDDREALSGSLLFGGIDTAKYTGNLANIAMYPSADTGVIDRFTVAFTSFSISSSSGSDTLTPPGYAQPVVLDSGTTWTYLPDDLAQAIFNEVGATFYPQAGVTICSCGIGNAEGTLSFGFAGADGPVIKVPISEMVYPLTYQNGTEIDVTPGTPACIFGIGPASSLGDGPILFGDTLLRSAYVVYDLANFRIGMAPTDFNSTGSNIVAFASSGAPIPSATTVTNEFAVTQTAGTGIVGATGVGTAGSVPVDATATGALFTGNAGPGFASATAVGKKNGVSAGPTPFAWEQLILVGLTTCLMGMGGVMFML